MGQLIYLLDTNVVSELSKADHTSKVFRRFRLHEIQCALCAPVVHELSFGLQRMPKGRRRTVLEGFFTELLQHGPDVLSYDRDASLRHASERVRLERKGLALPYRDAEIAAIASVNDLTLVTRNVRDFKLFAGLRIQNWFE